ncbi:hypothetical protein A7985_08765 [Pseudoalteromonas luteoviolacea]|uniref:Uncharacterized protein n=1 Tax=Pseudoalteromonas luteoviolacea TaxID=43657 RepID=A0A1C0TRM2_9GAMM|nr:hypothetical protein [Pseudoalteromonas luteoviolacea]OCQ21891.1 hypothetical protein A7985_08765 [Pseudoalteromonas luteoviolacea]
MSDSIYRALKGLSRKENISHNTHSNLPNQFEIKIYLTYLTSIIVAIIVAFIWQITQLEQFKLTSLILLMLGYIGIIIHPAIIFFLRRSEIRDSIRNPLAVLYNNAKLNDCFDKKYMVFLHSKSLEDLEFTLLEVKAEKVAFEKRTSLLVGSIERVGFAPGVLALLISLDKLNEIELDWVLSIAYAIPILYFFGAFSHILATKIGRHIAIIELVIEKKKARAHPRRE